MSRESGFKTVAIIEDEKEIRELVALHLLRQKYNVAEYESAQGAVADLETQNWDVVIVDWMLPGLSGIEFIQNYKKSLHKKTAVLMVTARGEPQDIVQGLAAGADDYVVKPFDPAVLLARVHALTRRLDFLNQQTHPHLIVLGDLALDLQSHEVKIKSEKLHLTPSEYKLLATLVAHRGKVLTRDELISQVQGEGITVIGRTVDTHVFGLRKKLGEWSDHIETLRGVGYRVNFE